MSILVLIFRGLLSSAIYDIGKVAATKLFGCRVLDKRYRKAFEKAVCRFYADPEYAGREARRHYRDYLKMLQDASRQEDILDSTSHVYQGMLDSFIQEVDKDPILQINIVLRGLFATQKKLKDLTDKTDEIIRLNQANREESKHEHKKICEQINGLKELIKSPNLQSLTLASIFGSAVAQNEQESHIVYRQQLVERCVAALDNGKLLILYGALKVGKTTLAQMVIKEKAEVEIIRVVAEQDLDIMVTSLLAASKNGKVIVTTPAALNKNISTINFSLIEQIEIPLLNKSETIELINTYASTDLAAFIYGHSCGHPVLVKTLCSYFSACGWTFDLKNFDQILSYSFDHDLKRVLSSLMTRLIIDEETRILLNRLILVHGSFTEAEVRQLAEVEPQIAEASRRLYSLIPSWVMNEGARFRISPLLNKLWRADLSDECRKQCNKILSQNILNFNRPLTEQDILNYITYSVDADEFDNAGRMYITVLIKLYDDNYILPKKSLLRSVWVDIPLPEAMSLEIKIGFRLTQLLLLRGLSKRKRHYLFWDVKQLLESYKKDDYRAFFYYVITLICWQEGDVADGLKYNAIYQSLDKNKTVNIISQLGEGTPLRDNNIWLFLLQLKNVDEYEAWLESFQKAHENYSHDDKEVCDCCYLAILRLTQYHLRDNDSQTKQMALERIWNKAEQCGCPEVAIVCLFRILDLYAIIGRPDEAKVLYNTQYEKYREYPLAVVLLNGALAYSCYRNKKTSQENWCYFEQVINFPDKELIPDIQLHIKELFAYVVAEKDKERSVELLNEALEYSNNENHRVDIFEYYQCKGELSYAYWSIGKREKAVELLSACVDFVLPLAEAKKEFAKTYLCLCNCLMTKYDMDVQGKLLPEKQASPERGMFTENNLKAFDDLFTEDRLYATCYQMSDLCERLHMNQLAYSWAKKTVEVCRRRGETKEVHKLLFLLVPLLSMEDDMDDLTFILKHSDVAGRIEYQYHPEREKENYDINYVVIQIVPLLMQALTMQIRGSDVGLKLVKKNISEYVAFADEETINVIKNIFERTVYDKAFIAEINQLDIKKWYVVYLCAYMRTVSYSDSDYAFDLLMAIIPTLQEKLVEVYGSRIMNVINKYISSFWKERILRAPQEFEEYDRLKQEGMKRIDEYEGMLEQSSKTMMVVFNHLRLPHKMNKAQEDWLYA